MKRTMMRRPSGHDSSGNLTQKKLTCFASPAHSTRANISAAHAHPAVYLTRTHFLVVAALEAGATELLLALALPCLCFHSV